MNKVYTSRPEHWTDKDGNSSTKQSKISEYQSGKVQKNVASTDAITQEELVDGSRKVLKSAKVVTEGSDGKLEITEEAKTKFTQRSNTSSEKYFAKNHTEKVITNSEDIEADTINTSYKADSTTFDFNNFTETGNVGTTQISASKSISINSDTVSFTAPKITQASITSKIKAKKNITKAPRIKTKAGKIEKKFDNFVMDADFYRSTLSKQEYQATETASLEDYEKEKGTYYIGEAIYISKSKKLYFINKQDCKKAFRLSHKWFLKADIHNESVFNHNTKYGSKNNILNNYAQKNDKAYTDAIVDKGEVFAISLVRPSMVVVNESKLASLDVLALDFGSSNLDSNGLIVWDSVLGQLKSKLSGNYKDVSFGNKDAVNDAIKQLQRLSDKDINQWLKIGKTKDTASLYMGLNQPCKHTLDLLTNRRITLVNRPVFGAIVDYDDEVARTESVFNHFKDDENGIFELTALELFKNGSPLMSYEFKLKHEGNKHLLKTPDSDKYSKDNEFEDATLEWKQTVNLGYSSNALTTLNLATLYKEEIQSKQLINPYEVVYNQEKDTWLIYLNSSYIFKSKFPRPARIPRDYPNGDAFCMEINTEDFVLEYFMYQQLARHNFELDKKTLSKNNFEALERRCLYQMLMDTYDVPADRDVKEYLKSLQNGGKTIAIKQHLDEMDKAPNELLLAIPPSAVGKLLYCIINADLMEYKQEKLDDIRHQSMLACLRLLATINTKKGYLVALQNFQPFTEYSKTNEEDAVDAIWHKMGSPLYFKDYGDTVTESYGQVYGAYKVMNSLDMELAEQKNNFAIHDFTVFPYVDVEHERKADAIVKQLKDGTVILEDNYPTTKLKLFTQETPINPNYVKGYWVTGKVSLDGEISVQDTSSPMKPIELTADAKKGIEAKAKTSLGNALADIKVDNFDIESAKPTVKFTCSLGAFDLEIEQSSPTLNGFSVKGSLSNSPETISKELKNDKFKGSLSLGFDITGVRRKQDEEAVKVNVAEVAGVVLLGLSVIVAPELIPLFAVGTAALT